MLGFASYAGLGHSTTIPITTFDANVQIGNVEDFTGPNAISQFGRPVPLDCASYTCPMYPAASGCFHPAARHRDPEGHAAPCGRYWG